MTTDAGTPGAELERRLVQALEARGEVLDAYLFGSQATGRAQAHSDIDVAVCIDSGYRGGSGYGYAEVPRRNPWTR
ncbi:MAG: nucleotidyltransferase domain-containing protein [Pseudomonadota bacterium]